MDDLRRLHIVGCPRSGTTLLQELLATCFDIRERSAFDYSIFEQFNTRSGVVLSKQPTDVLHMQQLLVSDRTLHVIYIQRDPRAVITSKQWGSKGYHANYRIWKECVTAAHCLTGHPRFLQIRYEDLVSDPDRIQQQILRRFPFLVFKHMFSQFEKFARPGKEALEALNGLRAVDAGSLHKWQLHLPRVKAQLMEFPSLQRDLEFYGYERDSAWQKLLTEVTPQRFPCRYGDRTPLLKGWDTNVSLYFKTRRYLRQLGT